MADSITATMETRGLAEALHRMPDAIAAATKAASKVSAESIQREARRRVRRKTGATAEGIVIAEMHNGSGYVVQATNRRTRSLSDAKIAAAVSSERLSQSQVTNLNIPLLLEAGTKHMDAKPFFYDSARLEVNAHDRRISEAVGRAIASSGLGD